MTNLLTMNILAEPVLKCNMDDVRVDELDTNLPLNVSTESLEDAPRLLRLLFIIFTTRIVLVFASLDISHIE